MHKLSVLINKLVNHSFIRFAIVGGIATAINYGCYVLLIQKFDNLYPSIAYIIAFCVSIVCNYLLSSYFTFGVKPSWKRAFKFLTAHLINLVNEIILLQIWLWVGIPKLYAPLYVFVIAFPINYFMVRFALKGRKTQNII